MTKTIFVLAPLPAPQIRLREENYGKPQQQQQPQPHQQRPHQQPQRQRSIDPSQVSEILDAAAAGLRCHSNSHILIKPVYNDFAYYSQDLNTSCQKSGYMLPPCHFLLYSSNTIVTLREET